MDQRDDGTAASGNSPISSGGRAGWKWSAIRVMAFCAGILNFQYMVPFLLHASSFQGMEWMAVLMFGASMMMVYGAMKGQVGHIRIGGVLSFLVPTLFPGITLTALVLGWRYGVFHGLSVPLFALAYPVTLGITIWTLLTLKGARGSAGDGPAIRRKENVADPRALRAAAVALALAMLTAGIAGIHYHRSLSALEEEYYPPQGQGPSRTIHAGTVGIPSLLDPRSPNHLDYNRALLEMASSLDSGVVCISIHYDAWLENDTAVLKASEEFLDLARDSGLELMFLDRGSSSTLHGRGMTLERYSEYRQERLRHFAERWNPEYYAVACEISHLYRDGVVAPRGERTPLLESLCLERMPCSDIMSGEINAEGWTREIDLSAGTVKAVSPGTRVGAVFGSEPAEWAVYRKVLTLVRVDFIGVTLHGVWAVAAAWDHDAFGDLQSNLGRGPASAGKDLFIIGTWSCQGGSHGQPWRSGADIRWLRAVYGFASSINATMIMPDHSYHMISYRSPAFRAPDPGDRTPTWKAYRDMGTDGE